MEARYSWRGLPFPTVHTNPDVEVVCRFDMYTILYYSYYIIELNELNLYIMYYTTVFPKSKLYC